ncbi:MAG TPA: SAM-dependent methyltransferase [Bryobacteraceae bacterium]
MAASSLSRTCLMVAAGRALGSREPDEGMRNPDYLADRLLGPEEKELMKDHPISGALDKPYEEARKDMSVFGTTVMMLIRTKFIDEKVRAALESGATQMVILGAGFDTRAYRFAELLKGKRAFEVDSEATQSQKRKRAAEALGDPPENLTYVTIDFNRDKLGDVLRRAGYRPEEKTVFTWEGVSMYVAEEGVRETLRTIATESAPGSVLIMDYTTEAVLEFMGKFPNLGPASMLKAWGEPWVFGIPDGEHAEFFTPMGLEIAEEMPMFGPIPAKRYLTRMDGTVFGMATGSPNPPEQKVDPEVMAAVVELGKKTGGLGYAVAELKVRGAA